MKNKISINLRMDEEMIDLIRRKAEQAGLPYQTFINVILKRYIKGDLVEKAAFDLLKEAIVDLGRNKCTKNSEN